MLFSRPNPDAEYQALVHYEASVIYRTLPPNRISLEDLEAYGWVGLLEAKKRFNPAYGVKFKTFAQHRIRGEILDQLGRNLIMPRHQYRAVRDQLLQESINTASNAERADAELVSNAVVMATEACLLEDVNEGDFMSKLATDPRRAISQRDAISALRHAVDDLQTDERSMIQACFDLNDKGDSAAAHARRHHVERSTISRRLKRTLNALHDHLKK